MKRINLIPYVIFVMVVLSLLITGVLNGQSDVQSLSKVILEKDSLFWIDYNTCVTDKLDQFFTENVEFYHDKGGVTNGVMNLENKTKKNLCSNPDYKLRREAIKESIHLYPMSDGDKIYGAILSGEHLFYVNETNKPERLDGKAKFTHFWIKDGDNWKMSRVLSYDHGPAPYNNKRNMVKLSDATLGAFAGQYIAPHAGICIVQKANDHLLLTIGDKSYILYPESASTFFVNDRDLTFDFILTNQGSNSKFVVKENGKVVEEAKWQGQ